jgi:hypothetical protein
MKIKYTGLLTLILTYSLSGCYEQEFYSAFPPDGYFDPLLVIELKPDVLKYGGEITHQYSGDYSISLSFERSNPIGKGYDLQSLDVKCIFGNVVNMNQVSCGISLLPYWGEESGVSIGIYNVPEAVNRKEPVFLSLEFQSIQELEDIIDSYGKVSISIEKRSDL